MNRTPTARLPSVRRRESAVGRGAVLSILLHIYVLVMLVQVASLAPATPNFDVFAADPLEVPAERAVETVQSPPPRPQPITLPPRRSPRPAAAPSRVAARTAKDRPADHVAAARPTSPVTTAPPESEVASYGFAGLEPPTDMFADHARPSAARPTAGTPAEAQGGPAPAARVSAEPPASRVAAAPSPAPPPPRAAAGPTGARAAAPPAPAAASRSFAGLEPPTDMFADHALPSAVHPTTAPPTAAPSLPALATPLEPIKAMPPAAAAVAAPERQMQSAQPTLPPPPALAAVELPDVVPAVPAPAARATADRSTDRVAAERSTGTVTSSSAAPPLPRPAAGPKAAPAAAPPATGSVSRSLAAVEPPTDMFADHALPSTALPPTAPPTAAPDLPALATPLEAVKAPPLAAAAVTPSERQTQEPPPTPPPHVETISPRVAGATPARPGGPERSALGLGLARLRIRLDGARTRTTDRETDIISGTLVGGEPGRVVVRVGERTTEAMRAGRAFTAPVLLSPGTNLVRVVATDGQGAEVEELVTVHYAPAVTPDLVITSPIDGHTLSPDDPPTVVVRGQVRGNVSTVWVFANELRMPVPVSDGAFSYVVPVLEPTVRLHAETSPEGGRSATVAVHTGAALPSLGLWLADWPRETAGPPQVTVTWRPSPDRLEGGVDRLPAKAMTGDASQAVAPFFYLRNARPGVYTLVLTYRASAPATVRPVVQVGGSGPRTIQPLALDGSRRVVVARILLPQGVLWEQDDWFTGRSASGGTVTKFRFPDGLSWIERVGDDR